MNPAYRTYDEKRGNAEAYVRDEALPWTVVIDDLEGTVHHTYGPMSDPAFLIDADGRVAFYEKWTSPPALHRAIVRLLAQGGRGVVASGLRRRMQPGPALTDGWRAVQRGLPQSAEDFDRAIPGTSAMLRLGDRLRPITAPFTLRARPIAKPLQVGAAASVLGLLAGVVLSGRKTHSPSLLKERR